MNRKNAPGHILLIFLTIPFLLAAGWCGLQIHKLSKQKTEIKTDYAFVHSIHSGLLSVEAWSEDIVEIFSVQIDSFSFTDQQEATLKEQINGVLNGLITEAEKMVQDGSKLKKIAINTFVDWKEVRQRIPAFSEVIIQEIKKPQTQESIKEVINQKLREYASQVYEPDHSEAAINTVFEKYDVVDSAAFDNATDTTIQQLEKKFYTYSYIVLGILILFLLAWFLIYRLMGLRQTFFFLSLLLALIVLITALITPMIEIDARISNLDFSLLGDHLIFDDQVLFLQSKSIVEVVQLLVKTGKGDSVFVGILILIFSILFPMAKLISTEIYLLGKDKIRNNKIIQYLAFKSGKWSMADVMVIAIFMAYVGFKNILSDQLEYLNIETNSLTSITTNETSLQPGFLLFVGFVIFSLILSEVLRAITIHHQKKATGKKVAV